MSKRGGEGKGDLQVGTKEYDLYNCSSLEAFEMRFSEQGAHRECAD